MRGFVVLLIVSACEKSDSLMSTFVEDIQTRSEWSSDAQWQPRLGWLEQHVAWDIESVVDMVSVPADPSETLDEIGSDIREGLREAAAGPGAHIPSITSHWRTMIGEGSCHLTTASDNDERWARGRLLLKPMDGTREDSRKIIAEYARRASETREFTTVECGGPGHLVVGHLGDRLVPILRMPPGSEH